MPITQTEFDALLQDRSKRIEGDLQWTADEDHSPTVEFRAELATDAGYPLFIRGSFNPLAKALTFALIHREVGRIYALDMGKDHHNPACHYVGETHKHRYTDQFRDKEAYAPPDITAPSSDPVGVWRQFCEEAGIVHEGVLQSPPAAQEVLFP